jgi:hypothetical protein
MKAAMAPNNALERSLSTCGACSARATKKFARASLGGRRRGAAHAGRYARSFPFSHGLIRSSLLPLRVRP